MLWIRIENSFLLEIMLNTVATIIRSIDRVFPRAHVEGRESSEAYSQWEYRLGKSLLEDHADHFGDLAGKRILDAGCGLGGKTVAYVRTFNVTVNFSGKGVTWDEPRCTGCGNCLTHCPTDALRVPDRATMAVAFNESKCVECLACIAACPYGACASAF